MKAKKILGIIGGVLAGSACVFGYKKQKEQIGKDRQLCNRYKSYYFLTNQWLRNKQQEKDVSMFFKDRQYKKIAVYGCGSIGELFYQDIKEVNDIDVVCFIDGERIEDTYGDKNIKILHPENIDFFNIDVIVVTPICEFDEIKKKLVQAGCTVPVLSLEEIVFGI